MRWFIEAALKTKTENAGFEKWVGWFFTSLLAQLADQRLKMLSESTCVQTAGLVQGGRLRDVQWDFAE